MFQMAVSRSNSVTRSSYVLLVLAVFFGLTVPTNSQDETTPGSQTSQTSNDKSRPQATPIPLSNIVTKADSDAKKLQEIRSEITENPAITAIEQELPKLSKALDARVGETREILSARPSLETLSSIEEQWQAFAKSINAWKNDLKTTSDDLNKKLEELKHLKALWQQTLESISKLKKPEPDAVVTADSETEKEEASGVTIPPEVLEKIRFTVDEISKTQKSVEQKRAELLTLQTRVSEQGGKIDDQLKSVKQAHERALSNLFVKDHPAIWTIWERGGSSSEILEGDSRLVCRTSQFS